MMQPEDKIQEIAERAERLQEIGNSILRAARDELYLGMRFFGCGAEQIFLIRWMIRSMDLERMEE